MGSDRQYVLDFGSEVCDKSDDSSLDLEDDAAVARRLAQIVDELRVDADMGDWKIDLQYVPGTDSENIAEVSCTVHKEADITFYRYRPDYVHDDVLHELMHCKVFLIRNSYAKVIDGFGEMLGELVTGYEELVVDDLARMLHRHVSDKDEDD